MKKYIIFGAGDTGKSAIQVFGKENVRFFIDNDEAKQKAGFEGYEVKSLKQAKESLDGCQIVLAVIPKYEPEIKEQLEAEGITNYLLANTYIYEERRRRLSERTDYLATYQKAIAWVKEHTIEGRGIAVSSTEQTIYPEVTGYYIPSLLRWGYRDLALSYAQGLLDIQRTDGAWNAPDGKTPYVFDTAQILKGLLAIRPFLPTVDMAIRRGADWMLSNMRPDGRLTTPNQGAWGEDSGTCSELIHLYCLSPLVSISEITGDHKYAEAANRILDYYLTNDRERIVKFRHLSHFHAYLMEALLDMGRFDVAKEAMENMERHQKANGAVPAYYDCDWVCSTGLFQLALVWYRLGNIDRGNRAFYYACDLQNESGGWYGSYLSEDNLTETNTYFPLSEISWANKYFLDALYEKNKAEFNDSAPQFLYEIDSSDGRYEVIRRIVAGTAHEGGLVVDVGCGKGRYIRKLQAEFQGKSFLGVDISREVLSFAGRGIETREGTLTAIPLPNDAADVTYTCEALEHAIDVSSAMREMVRVTKAGGYIVIVDKNKNALGRLEIAKWEQWFDVDELCEQMRPYCSEVNVIEKIDYDGHDADGLFAAWIGKVK